MTPPIYFLLSRKIAGWRGLFISEYGYFYMKCFIEIIDFRLTTLAMFLKMSLPLERVLIELIESVCNLVSGVGISWFKFETLNQDRKLPDQKNYKLKTLTKHFGTKN